MDGTSDIISLLLSFFLFWITHRWIDAQYIPDDGSKKTCVDQKKVKENQGNIKGYGCGGNPGRDVGEGKGNGGIEVVVLGRW